MTDGLMKNKRMSALDEALAVPRVDEQRRQYEEDDLLDLALAHLSGVVSTGQVMAVLRRRGYKGVSVTSIMASKVYTAARHGRVSVTRM